MSKGCEFCRQPDRDVPEVVCGYPLPCPYHTVTIDTTTEPPSIHIPITNPRALRPKMLHILKDIGNAIAQEPSHE